MVRGSLNDNGNAKIVVISTPLIVAVHELLKLGVDEHETEAVVILHDERGRAALQLRDIRQTVAFANYWGLFGGWLETNETPVGGAIRETFQSRARRPCVRREAAQRHPATPDNVLLRPPRRNM